MIKYIKNHYKLLLGIFVLLVGMGEIIYVIFNESIQWEWNFFHKIIIIGMVGGIYLVLQNYLKKDRK